MKRFIVIGLDGFGYNLALSLARRQHEVMVIDSNEESVQNIKDSVTTAITADIKDGRHLKKLVDNTVDAVIVSVGEEIATSVLTVIHLKDFGVTNIVAKAINSNHEKILQLVGATETILPERDAADKTAIKLTTKNLVEHIPLAEDYSITEIAVPDNLIGRTLAELNIRNKYNVEVIAVKNVLLNEFYLIPKSDFKLGPDYALVVIGKEPDIEKITL